MREILFRGKTKAIAGSPYNNGKPDGEWVKGYLYNDVGCLKIRHFETDYADYIPYEVDPETVGQYTGLVDLKGNKIFEGDICSSNGNIYQIVWLDDIYGWFCKVLKSNTCLIDTTMAFPLYQYHNCPENGYRQLEVIGNIHDNPKLLKEGAE